MQIMNHDVPINNVLLDKSLLLIGGAGAGKTYFLKKWILSYQKEYGVSKNIGIICLENEMFEYEQFVRSSTMNLSFFQVDLDLDIAATKKIESEEAFASVAAFIERLDVVIIDEGRLTIGKGEVLHHLLDLCEDKIVVAAYQSLDQLSSSQVYLESVMKRFDKQIFFKLPRSFSADFILGKDRAVAAYELERAGKALVVELSVE